MAMRRARRDVPSEVTEFGAIVSALDFKEILRINEIWEEAKQKVGRETIATLLMFRIRMLVPMDRRTSATGFSPEYENQCKVLMDSLDSIIQLLGPDMDEEETGYHSWRLGHKQIPVEHIATALPDCLNAILGDTAVDSDDQAVKATVCSLLRHKIVEN